MIESTATSNIIQSLSENELLAGALNFCQKNAYGLAVWQLPSQDAINVFIDDSEDFTLSDIPLEDLSEGFIFAPFEKKGKRYFIKAKLKINLESKSIEGNGSLREQLECHLDEYDFKQKSDKIDYTIESNPSDDFINLVKNSISNIQRGHFQKVVPSRFKKITFKEGINPGSIFSNLTANYKTSFVSLVYTSETNLWIGATPETLISTKDSKFTTVALAGTQKHNHEIDTSDIAWTQKEIEEQAFVSRYIINCFKKIRLREFEELGPKTIQAGNLIHLKTEYTVDMEATNFPQLGSVMLDLLHPTSAVCGMPLESAYNFIKANEHYDRKFFSGYLGPVNSDGSTAIFVNLRCLELDGNQGTLYAGAGVTESSNPSKEWNETELKMNTILNVLES
ncbi:MAG: chorismate-binding protein [Fulvivirga sp.]